MRFIVLGIFGLLALAPLAAAGPQPAIYYLQDGATPLGDGTLDSEPPSKNETSYRPITYGPDGPVVWFDASAPTDRLLGRAFVGLWPEAFAVTGGNITAGLYIDDGTTRTLISETGVPIATDPSNLPDPMALIPPDPTDPEGAIFHVASQVLPLVSAPPMLLDLGFVDATVPANATVLLGIHLSAGADGLPPVGTFLLKYDAPTAPSFVYAPWYAPDPAPTSSTGTRAPTSTATPTNTATPSSTSGAPLDFTDDEEPEGKDSPGIGIVFLAAALLAFVAVRRQR